MGGQRGQRAFLVLAHQPRVARDIGSEDGGEAALDGHGSALPASFAEAVDEVLLVGIMLIAPNETRSFRFIRHQCRVIVQGGAGVLDAPEMSQTRGQNEMCIGVSGMGPKRTYTAKAQNICFYR